MLIKTEDGRCIQILDVESVEVCPHCSSILVYHDDLDQRRYCSTHGVLPFHFTDLLIYYTDTDYTTFTLKRQGWYRRRGKDKSREIRAGRYGLQYKDAVKDTREQELLINAEFSTPTRLQELEREGRLYAVLFAELVFGDVINSTKP